MPLILWAAGLAGLWTASRGYPGLYHDARLYAAQALHRLDAQKLEDDLLFRYGTQDAYSLFSHLHAPLVRILGLDAGTQALLALSHLLWLGALMFLAASLFSDWRKYLFSAAAIALPAGYSHLILGYGESFLTPRPAAEALVMIGLACFLRGRLAWAVAGLLMAALLHPLMALAGWAVAGLLMLIRRPRLAWLIGPPALLAPLAAWALNVAPFEGLLRPMDVQWTSFVQQYNPVLFLSQWDAQDFSVFALDTAVCLGALLLASPHVRLFIAAALTAGLAGVLVNLAAADVLHLELFVQMQFSRLLWIVHLAAALSWTLVAARVCSGRDWLGFRGAGRNENRRPLPTPAFRNACLGLVWMAAALLTAHTQTPSAAASVYAFGEVSVLTQFSAAGSYPFLSPLLSMVGLFFLWRSHLALDRYPDSGSPVRGGALTRRIFAMLLIPPAAALLFALPSLWFGLQSRLNASAALQVPYWKAWGWILMTPLAAAALAWTWRLHAQRRKTAAWGLVALTLAASMTLRDRRASRQQRWEAAGFQLFSGLSTQDVKGRQIYWDDAHNLALWYGLGTPCYLTWTHRAVAPFFRSAAMEWQRRLAHSVPLWSAPGALRNKSIAPLPPESAHEACRDPELDAVVLSQPDAEARPFDFDGRTFYLLYCR